MALDNPTPIDAQAPRSGLDALVDQAIATIAAVLADPSVPARDRANIALQVLRLSSAAGDNTAVLAVSGPPNPAPAGAPLPLAFVTIPDFLQPDLHAAAIAAALAERDHFEPSTVMGKVPDTRRSQVRFGATFPVLHDALRCEINAVLPSVFAGLGRAPFIPGDFELHMTVHGHGDFFRMHGDATAPETATREITFVYYFMPRLPRGFSGGALRLYQTWDSTTTPYDVAQFHDIDPTDNMIVFFDSRLLHEVLPVTVPSGAFQDGRFTLNGWLHHQEAVATQR